MHSQLEHALIWNAQLTKVKSLFALGAVQVSDFVLSQMIYVAKCYFKNLEVQCSLGHQEMMLPPKNIHM
jgi:hypothetical protein